MKLRLRRSLLSFALIFALLFSSASAVLSSEHNVLYTAQTPELALEQLQTTLGVTVEYTAHQRLSADDLANLEDAVDLFSLSLFRALNRYCRDKYDLNITLRFCDPDDSDAAAYSVFDPGGSYGKPFIGCQFFLFSRSNRFYGNGTSVRTYLHELTHLAHMIMEDMGKADELEKNFLELNGTYSYNENANVSSPEWHTRGTQIFYREYGTKNVFEDVSTLAEGTADLGVKYAAYLEERSALKGKYAALSSAMRAVYPEAQQAPFLSVLDADEPSPWAADAIDRARQLSVLDEELDGAYSRSITRLEFCWLAVDMLETLWKEDVKSYLRRTGYDLSLYSFTDVDDGAVSAMAALGVVSGRGEGIFDPNAPIKRSEAARLLALTAAVAGGEEVFANAGTPRSFSDRAALPMWAVTSVDRLSAAGIMNGTGTKFEPNGSYTREQSVTSLMRLYDYLAA